MVAEREKLSKETERLIEGTAAKLQPSYTFSKEDAPTNVLGGFPNPTVVVTVQKNLFEILLPGRMFGGAEREDQLPLFLKIRLEEVASMLLPQLERAIPFRWLGTAAVAEGKKQSVEVKDEALRVLKEFFDHLPTIRAKLVEDTRAAYRGDPAALSFAEVQLAYPGLLAIASHRLAHKLYELDVPIVPRIMSEWTHTQTGVDIHPGARIGEGFFIDHCTGVVIGETTRIGNNVKIYQGATLGAKSFPVDSKGNPVKHIQRHPTVQDNVIIYANAVILGGDTVIGAGSVIGGGVCLMESVPPNTLIVEKRPELQVKQGVKKS